MNKTLKLDPPTEDHEEPRIKRRELFSELLGKIVDLMEQSNVELRLVSGDGTEYTVLSVYEADDARVVWIDIQEDHTS